MCDYTGSTLMPNMGITKWSKSYDVINLTIAIIKLETHTISRNILPSCLNARKSGGHLVAFDVLVTVY